MGQVCSACLAPEFLDQKKKSKKRVLCAGKTFVPYGMKAGGPPPAITKEYQPTKTGMGDFCFDTCWFCVRPLKA